METEKPNEVILEVTSMNAVEVTVQCPHCDEVQRGFIGNPAGGEFKCEFCGVKYKIHPEADIEFI